MFLKELSILLFILESVKWVGLFVILFAGLTTVQDLWDILGDLSNSLVSMFFDFLSIDLFLIL